MNESIPKLHIVLSRSNLFIIVKEAFSLSQWKKKQTTNDIDGFDDDDDDADHGKDASICETVK